MNKKEKRPRIKKVDYEIFIEPDGYWVGVNFYVRVNVEFLDGTSHSRGFPCSHSPYFQLLKTRYEILKDRIGLFNDKRVYKRIG